MFERRKNPQDEIKEIEEKFKKQIPGLNEYQSRRKKIYHYFVLSLPIMIGVILLFYFLPQKEEKSTQRRKIDVIEKEQEVLKKKPPERQKKVLCIVKVPFDNEVISIAVQKGISDFKINTKKTKEKVIKFFVGDFANIEDTAFVSARLNEKGIPNSVEEKNGKWRVYINLKAQDISKIPVKRKITKKLLSHLKRIMEKKTGEIVNVEVVEEEREISTAIFEFQDRRSCRRFFSVLRSKGKKSKIEFYVEAKNNKLPPSPYLSTFYFFHNESHTFISHNLHPISLLYL